MLIYEIIRQIVYPISSYTFTCTFPQGRGVIRVKLIWKKEENRPVKILNFKLNPKNPIEVPIPLYQNPTGVSIPLHRNPIEVPLLKD